ncbi:MAG: hypothetical protein QY322_00190 [bacterium]|nr:MAG: hypothetical protein QY322_00190 [bacterium]
MAKKKVIKKFKLNKWIKILLPLLVLVIGSMFILSKSTSEISFNGCGTDFPNYKYSLKFPFLWTFKQTVLDSTSSYYEVSGPNSVFTVSCTNQGVGGGCNKDYWTTINVNGRQYDACLQKIDGTWNMSNVNFSDTSVENIIVSFWSEGLDKIEIEKILSSFKRL